MASVLLISDEPGPVARVLPALALLPHATTLVATKDSVLTESANVDAVIVDARTDLVTARDVCHLFSSAGVLVPRLAVVNEGGLTVITPDWGLTDFVLASAGPAELDARLRRATAVSADETISSGGILIDEAAYSVHLEGEPLDLTYTEFELLRYLVQHPGRVFSREHLLAEVWGYDYYGGTRTVDVHVRRLRAKLGPEHEALIGTVRNVGYRFSPR